MARTKQPTERAKWCLEAVLETGALKADSRTRKLCLDAFLDKRERSLPPSTRTNASIDSLSNESLGWQEKGTKCALV